MRRVAKTLAAIALATGATFGGLALGSPAMATGVTGGSLITVGNVDVTATDIASGNTVVLLQNVAVTDAAKFCQVNVDVLTAALIENNQAVCASKTNSKQKASVKKH